MLASALVLALAGGCEPLAGKCEPVDESTRVDLVVDLGGFDPPGASADGYLVEDLSCTVAAVSLPTIVRTELDCETAPGTTHTLAIQHAASDLGEPAWSVGDPVLLSIELRVQSDLNDIRMYAIAMRSPEGEPQLLVMDTNEDYSEAIAAPIVLSLDEGACPQANAPDGESRGLLTLGLDGATAEVGHGRDTTLETATGTWAVELERALSGDFGERTLFFELLVMKLR